MSNVLQMPSRVEVERCTETHCGADAGFTLINGELKERLCLVCFSAAITEMVMNAETILFTREVIDGKETVMVL